METLKGAERRVEAGVKCCGQKGQSLPPSPHSGHLKCGLLASVLGVEVSVASGHPVSVSGRVVSCQGACLVSAMLEAATKLVSKQPMSNTRGQHLPWVLREEAG